MFIILSESKKRNLSICSVAFALQPTKKAWRCWENSIPSAHNQSLMIAILLMFYSSAKFIFVKPELLLNRITNVEVGLAAPILPNHCACCTTKLPKVNKLQKNN
jgi:hypothetical protein